jgi:hypothetical protein
MPEKKLTREEEEKAKMKAEIEFAERARAALARAIQRAQSEKDDPLYVNPLLVLVQNIERITTFLTTPVEEPEKQDE